MTNVDSSAWRDEPASSGGLGNRLLRRVVLGELRRLGRGQLTLIDADDRIVLGERGLATVPRATIRVLDPSCYRRLAFGGSIGLAEAYMDGLWTCDDLTTVLRIATLNHRALGRLERLPVTLRSILTRLARPRDTLAASRAHVAAHYDLGNDFFSLFLDDTKMYSCGLFASPETPMREASLAKLRRVSERLALGPDDHVLEIGSGWGGFAIYAAERYGCRVTTTTLSREQLECVTREVRDRGLGDRVTVLRNDFRELGGCYDKLVSIEMIEAIGHRAYDTFFRCCAQLLKPGGMMLLQAITILPARYEKAKDEIDFIKQYIFPGTCIPSVKALRESMSRASDLALVDLEDLTPHYPLTLRSWRARFQENAEAVRALGFNERFLRMWDFYFCYCEAGFMERHIGDVQMLLARPRAPGGGA